MPKGFASLTKEQRRLVGAKGGRASQAGLGYRLDAPAAKRAAARSVATRKRKFARAAALVLLQTGLTAEQLNLLQLSEDELIYYGGSDRSTVRLAELLEKLKLKVEASNENSNPV